MKFVALLNVTSFLIIFHNVESVKFKTCNFQSFIWDNTEHRNKEARIRVLPYPLKNSEQTQARNGPAHLETLLRYINFLFVFPFQCPDSFLKFLQAVRESKSLDEDVGPPVVHCSAGIGRSGTFCLVDSCLVLVSWPVLLQNNVLAYL